MGTMTTDEATTERRVDVGDHDLPVDEFGSGRPFIWGHGLTSSRRSEDAYPMVRFPVLAERCRVVRYDARGHGTAGGPTDEHAYHWPVLAQDQLALADALAIDRYVAAGVSMGTATALHAAVQDPERVEALVLTAPPTAWESRADQAAVYRLSADFIEGASVEAWVEHLPPHPLFPDRPVESRIPDIPEALLPTVFRGAAETDLPDPDAIAALTMPVFIQAWAHDPGHPESTATRLHELLPHSELYVARSPAEFKGWTTRIVEFLDRL